MIVIQTILFWLSFVAQPISTKMEGIPPDNISFLVAKCSDRRHSARNRELCCLNRQAAGLGFSTRRWSFCNFSNALVETPACVTLFFCRAGVQSTNIDFSCSVSSLCRCEYDTSAPLAEDNWSQTSFVSGCRGIRLLGFSLQPRWRYTSLVDVQYVERICLDLRWGQTAVILSNLFRQLAGMDQRRRGVLWFGGCATFKGMMISH